MLEALQSWDQSLLHLINWDWSNSFFDAVMPVITDLHKFWISKFIIFPVFAVLLVLRKKSWGAFFLLFLILALATSDAIGGQILKPLFERLRPSVAGIDVIMRAPHFGGYSLPSNHAMNMFTFATFVSLIAPRFRILFFFIASLVAYSRVYCGVHYPSDVLAGAGFGVCIGWVFYKLFIQFQKRFHSIKKENTHV